MCVYCDVVLLRASFTSIHREGFFCQEQLEYQGKDQQCNEDASFLSQAPSSLL